MGNNIRGLSPEQIKKIVSDAISCEPKENGMKVIASSSVGSERYVVAEDKVIKNNNKLLQKNITEKDAEYFLEKIHALKKKKLAESLKAEDRLGYIRSIGNGL